MSLFALFYNFILLVVYIILTPYLIYKSKSKKYKIAIPAKFFLKNNPKFDKSGVWFHSCSMGEVRAIKPLIKEFEEESNISVITNTGLMKQKQFVKMLDFYLLKYFFLFG